jgi:FlaA1/EpsC-like NDP-sugar epimerase
MLNCSSRTILRFSVYKLFLLTTDIILINLATYTALFFRFDGKIPVQYINIYMNTFIWLTLIKISVYYAFRLYTSLWKYASIEELLQIFFATLTGAVGSVAFGVVTHLTLPRTVYAISWMLTFLLIGASRLSYRIIRKNDYVVSSVYLIFCEVMQLLIIRLNNSLSKNLRLNL